MTTKPGPLAVADARALDATVERLEVSAYTVPTDGPESDGTLRWDSTTLVLVEAHAAGRTGLGYTYSGVAAARLIHDELVPAVIGEGALAVPRAWEAMHRRIRNLGRPGVASCALAAVDIALWDLAAKLLELPLVTLLGATRESIPIYGSGGFTSYPIERLQRQLAGWVEQGIPRVKMKVGRDPEADLARVRAARQAIGAGTELFVDANGAFVPRGAAAFAERIAGEGVSWFEEPVSSDDLDGLALLRRRLPTGMAVAAGEYGYDVVYFRRLLEAGAVDVLQADVGRCAGVSELLRVAGLAAGFLVPLSAHTAPALHAHVCCAIAPAIHLEWFHDHVRIERLLFDGVLEPRGGALVPDRSRPGLGIELKRRDAARFRVAGS